MVERRVRTHGKVYHFPGTGYTSGISVATPLVKGLQGNVWTERIHTSERLQFMVYPPAVGIGGSRMDARSVKKNYENFNLRMDRMMEIYKKSGIVFFDYKNPPDSSPEVAGPEMRKKD